MKPFLFSDTFLYLDFLKEPTLFQQVASLEELAAQIHAEQENVLAFSLKPLRENDVMATASLLKQKVTIFMPIYTNKDLITNLKLQLDSRHDKSQKICIEK